MTCPFNYKTLSLLLLLAIVASGSCWASRTYTTCLDFGEGTLDGVKCSLPGQLQLNPDDCTTLPFIWVPNNNGTVSKVSTSTGKELGRYRVVPPNLPNLPTGAANFGSPSRTTVGTDGSCWVGCRTAGTVVKIGLLEAGQWIDRNHDGIVQTSRDLNNDGVITDGEVLPWGEDECVLYEVVLVPGHEGAHFPGAYAGPYDNNDATGTSPRALAVDSSNDLWVGSWGHSKYYHIIGATTSAPPTDISIDRIVDVAPHTPYGAVIDRMGRLWSAGRDVGDVLRMDPSTNPASLSSVQLPHSAYGMALDYLDHLFVSGFSADKITRIDITKTGQAAIDWTKPASGSPSIGLHGSRGVACTKDNDVWVANSLSNTVTRYDNDGNLKCTIFVGAEPTGVAVDADGKVWVCDNSDEFICRIDPATCAVDLCRELLESTGHYSYSDMTGSISRCITTNVGTWTVVYDSGAAATAWGKVSWNDQPGDPDSGVFPGSSLKVTVQSSNDNVTFSAAETADNGVTLSATPPGRYLRVVVLFQRTPGAQSPVLYDLTVVPLPEPPVVSANPATICSGSSATLSYSGGSGDTLNWSTSCHGTVIGTGNDLAVSPTSTTTYYAWWHNDAGDSDCANATVTVNPLPVAPSSASNNGPICSGNSATLSYSGGSGDTLNWSTTCHGTVIGTGNNLSVSPTSITTYYAWWHNGCGDSSCASTTVTVNPLPVAPTGASANPPTISPGACSTLTATGGSGDELRWSTSCHGNVIGTGASILVCPTITTTYYVWWHSISCGDSDCASVTVFVTTPKLLQAYCGLTCPGVVGNKTFEGFRGLGKDVITAVPGVLAFDPGANWSNFVTAAAAGKLYTVTNTSLRKTVPTYVCSTPIGGKPQLQQGTARISRWWPLMYELPGTKWTLTIWYSTAALWDDDGAGPNPRATNHQNVWTWEVDATLDSLEGIVRLFHELPAGSCQVPLISSEPLYVELLSNIETLKGMDPTDPEMAEVFLNFILLVEDNCLTVDCGACVHELGIRNTVENPACCKILADADYIAEALGVFK